MKRLIFVVPFLISASFPLAQAQDLPEGKGKDVVESVCGACHGTDLIASRRATKEGWSYIVDDMVSRGASATNEQIATIVDLKKIPELASAKLDTKKDRVVY